MYRAGRMQALTIIFIALLTGCVSAPQRTVIQQSPTGTADRNIRSALEPTGARISAQALALVGTPYLYGGTKPEDGFDCSGLVYYTYSENGISVPRTSQAQFAAATKIALNNARQGDLIFFQDQEKLSHVGIYLGDGQFVHAPASGRTVSVAQLDSPYYQQNMIAVGRLLP